MLSGKREVILPPHSIDDLQPLGSARVTIIVPLEMHAILLRFIFPPGRDDVEREPAAAADVIDVRGLLRLKRRLVKGWAHGDHQLKSLSHRRESCGG